MKSTALLDEIFSEITFLGTPVFYIAIIIFLIGFNLFSVWRLVLSLIFIELLCAAIKLIYKKERPMPQSREGLYNKIDASSFPSVHGARISFLAAIVALNCKNILFVIGGIIVAIVVCYSRIYLKRHDFKDIAGGVLIGVLVAVFSLFI